MRITYGLSIDNKRESREFKGNRVNIGRKPESDIPLEHPSIAPEHAIIGMSGKVWVIYALNVGPNAIKIGEKKLRKGEMAPIVSGQIIELFPYSFTVELPEQAVESGNPFDREYAELLGKIHLDLLRRMDLSTRGSTQREDSEEYQINLERQIEEIAKIQGFFEPAKAAFVDYVAGMSLRRQCVESLLVRAGAGKNALQADKKEIRLLSSVPEREKELQMMVAKTAERIGLPRLTDLSEQIAKIDSDFWSNWTPIAKDMSPDVRNYIALRFIKKELKDTIYGYGPLEDLLRIPTISEIMVVDRDHIFIEKSGVLENSGRRFINDEVTLAIIERIVAKVGRRVDKSSPLVDARLMDGSRVNAVIPPVAVSGPCLTVRKFPARKLTVNDLVEKGSFSKTAAEFLKAAVLSRKNILVSGGTGTGKTTLLNCLSDFIPDKERIVTIEDTAELQLQKAHVVRLETKAANVEGAGALTIRDLVKNALRMRPDRIVVGECRGGEALDMLQAMNSGHDGSLTTLHANNASDVVLRLEVLVQMASDLPIQSIHRQIASAVDLVVQLHRLRNGRRVVTQITEFVGIDPDFGGVRTRDLFLLDEEDPKATLQPTGSLPTFMEEIIAGGMLKLENFYQ